MSDEEEIRREELFLERLTVTAGSSEQRRDRREVMMPFSASGTRTSSKVDMEKYVVLKAESWFLVCKGGKG